jgi:hypothetical protein
LLEKIVFQKGESKNSQELDIGLLAEILLFYGTVTLIIDRSNLHSLLKQLGPSTLCRLISLANVHAIYSPDNAGVSSENNGVLSYDFMSFRMLAKSTQKAESKRQFVQGIFDGLVAKDKSHARIITQIASNLQTSDEVTSLHKYNLHNHALNDIDDKKYLDSAIRFGLERLVGENAPASFRFEPFKLAKGFAIDTDLDFVSINRSFKKLNPSADTEVTSAQLLVNILEARQCLHLASIFDASVVASTVSSQLMQLRMTDIINKIIPDNRQLDIFQSIVFDEGRSVRNSLNAGERKFDHFLDVLEKSSEFRRWIFDQPPSADLLRTYFSEVTSKTWIEKLPSRVVRFSFFTGAGLVADALLMGGLGTASALTLSLADSFLLDKMAKGWRPDQFVDGSLREFVSPRK